MEDQLLTNATRQTYSAIIGPEMRAIILKSAAVDLAGVPAFTSDGVHYGTSYKWELILLSRPTTQAEIEGQGEIQQPVGGDVLTLQILASIDKSMASEWAFCAAAAHHEPQYELKITVRSKPTFPAQDGSTEESVIERTGEVKISDKIVYPNKARAAAGLPSAQASMASDGSVSDFEMGVDPITASEMVVRDILKGA